MNKISKASASAHFPSLVLNYRIWKLHLFFNFCQIWEKIMKDWIFWGFRPLNMTIMTLWQNVII